MLSAIVESPFSLFGNPKLHEDVALSADLRVKRQLGFADDVFLVAILGAELPRGSPASGAYSLGTVRNRALLA